MTAGISAIALCLGASVSQAWHISGRILCDANGDQQFDAGDTPVENVTVLLENTGGTFFASVVSGADGTFHFEVPHTPDTYLNSLQAASLPTGATILFPPGGVHNIELTHANPEFEQANFLLDCSPPTSPGAGVRTPGYWKNHPDAWPVENITIGGVTYTKADALALMKPGGDRSLTMFYHLIATRLNILSGADSSCIAETVEAADIWLSAFPPGSGVKANSEAWTTAEPWKDMLDAYNNGELCALKAE